MICVFEDDDRDVKSQFFLGGFKNTEGIVFVRGNGIYDTPNLEHRQT